LEGKVEMKQAGQTAFAPAKPDAALEAQGQVQTGADGRSRLDLSTGTIVRVAPDSLFTLISNEEAAGGLFTKLNLELGKVFIILNGGNAEVQTPAGMAAVQGSYLKVEFDPAAGALTLTCLEGDCSVTAPGGETKHFSDGQKITIHKDPATGEWIMDEGPMSPEDFQEWLDNNPEAKEMVERVKALLDADLRDAALTAMPNAQLPGSILTDANKEKLKDLIEDPPFP
jgi:ferric-dicitrate binding protein FerR (iron transport regulator)